MEIKKEVELKEEIWEHICQVFYKNKMKVIEMEQITEKTPIKAFVNLIEKDAEEKQIKIIFDLVKLANEKLNINIKVKEFKVIFFRFEKLGEILYWMIKRNKSNSTN